ncbi:hypothetical protein [Blautia obeum]|uniref:hypothetical protein n=1 Tax=Blautia obeum TaxID=40520 RepID=UPI0015F3167E|nr:hypothetical protein [Blautia obeum]
MCKTMNELEKVVADYRGLKALKEQVEEELKAVEREIIGSWIQMKNSQRRAKISQ